MRVVTNSESNFQRENKQVACFLKCHNIPLIVLQTEKETSGSGQNGKAQAGEYPYLLVLSVSIRLLTDSN